MVKVKILKPVADANVCVEPGTTTAFSSKIEVFCCVDLLKKVDYLPTHHSSRRLFTIVAPWGETFELNGLPQGW